MLAYPMQGISSGNNGLRAHVSIIRLQSQGSQGSCREQFLDEFVMSTKALQASLPQTANLLELGYARKEQSA
eukprot:6490434-Amphidinium_carterae.7